MSGLRQTSLILAFIFSAAFGLNWLWEHLHAVLYVHYRGGEITSFILTRAALSDAFVITLGVSLFLFFTWLFRRPWLILAVGVIFAVGLELYALQTGRWAYNEMMPLLPGLGVGLTPTIQLGLIAYVLLRLVQNFFPSHSVNEV